MKRTFPDEAWKKIFSAEKTKSSAKGQRNFLMFPSKTYSQKASSSCAFSFVKMKRLDFFGESSNRILGTSMPSISSVTKSNGTVGMEAQMWRLDCNEPKTSFFIGMEG